MFVITQGFLGTLTITQGYGDTTPSPVSVPRVIYAAWSAATLAGNWDNADRNQHGTWSVQVNASGWSY